MDLNSIAGPVVAAVNPTMPVAIQISIGDTVSASGLPVPAYATPGSLTGSIAGGILTATAVSAGKLLPGQLLAGGGGLLAGTTIVDQLTGTDGGIGTYQLSQVQDVAAEAMTTTLVLRGQIQPMTLRDLQQVEGVNLGGVKWKIYLEGEVDAVVRPENKGGDLITIATGRHQGVWLVVQVLEQFQDWCCAAIVQQNPGS